MDTPTITVKLEGGVTSSLEVSLLEKYPTSPLTTHATTFRDTTYDLSNISLESFLKIQETMKGLTKESNLSKEDWTLANFYGLTCDSLYYLRLSRQKALDHEVLNLESFLKGDVDVFVHPDTALYDHIFKAHPKFFKVQVLVARGQLYGIFSRGLPLAYRKKGFGEIKESMFSNLESSIIKGQDVKINVNKHRQQTIFNLHDLKNYIGDIEIQRLRSEYGDDAPTKDLEYPRVKATVSEHLESYDNDDWSVSRFFSLHEDEFINEVATFTADGERGVDTLYVQDQSMLYDQTFIDFPETSVHRIFKILSFHLEVMKAEIPASGSYKYHMACYNGSSYNTAELTCYYLNQFYVNIE